MTVIIGVGGLLTAGKDVFADQLVEHRGFVKMGMSDALNEFLVAVNPIIDYRGSQPLRYAYYVDEQGYVEAKKHEEVRALLQRTGTEAGRKIIDENVWVDAAKKRILEHAAAGRNVVITGIRYPNELQLIEDITKAAVRVSDPLATSVWVSRPGLKAEGHTSETSVSENDFEYVLENDSTLEAFEAESLRFIDEILEIVE